MADYLSEKLTATRSVVETLKGVIETAWTSKTPLNVDPCCQFDTENANFEYDPPFKSVVDRDHICSKQADAETHVQPIDESILETMKHQLSQGNHIKWQHFGTQDGFFVSYPAALKNTDQCYDYDPRKRPW